MTIREQLLAHIESLRAAGVTLIPFKRYEPVNLSSAPAPVATDQFRRCGRCGATAIVPFTPSTAVPCNCGGEMLLADVTVADLRAERERCAAALERLAGQCRVHAPPDGRVSATGAADHMETLARWMRAG